MGCSCTPSSHTHTTYQNVLLSLLHCSDNPSQSRFQRYVMTLLNKKANQSDRISDLPANVIDGILGNLKIRDQVRTSILSRKWRYMWTSAPELCFDNKFFERYTYLEGSDHASVVSKIITDVLMLRNGPIHKFTLSISYDFHYDFKSNFEITLENLNMWIPFLSRDIKYLDLVDRWESVHEMPYIVFSCKELTYFKFGGFHLLIPPHFCGFKRLLELHLYLARFNSDALESLVSGCPFLEKLCIELCEGFQYLHISSHTLKVLFIDLLYDVKSICLKKADNLIDFTFEAKHVGLSSLFKSLPKVKLVGCNKNPYADIIPPTCLACSFNSLKYLKLGVKDLNETGELLHIVRVLKSAPSLVKLVIQSYNFFEATRVLDHSEELECRSCCLKLQIVDISVRTKSQHAMSLIQFILANSPLLKTLTFNFDIIKLDALELHRILYRISQDLLGMERASPRAHVKLLNCGN
ncbi:F-box/FBD/LRR-repeat protein At1g13570-like [Vicia villosa]|uniref:F-box/FBD/LRR-repeat protein At1g13570-like n=1 Tax=Vicia villosa TaxID=3911 RepID=UPI00273B798D|nr:F-box/FBD/LRR-repeat protein At1g13570-like [Vicia villosa]